MRGAHCEEVPPNFGDAAKGLTGSGPAGRGRRAARFWPGTRGDDRHFTWRCGEILATMPRQRLPRLGNYYTRNTLLEFVVILAPAAVFANTDFDADVGNWYQEHIRS